MKNFHYILALFAPLFVVLGGCKKEDDSVIKNPPSYSEGKNSGLGCIINGQRWWANTREKTGLGLYFASDHPRNPSISYGGSGSILQLSAYYYTNPGERKGGQLFRLYLESVSDTGYYLLGNNIRESTVEFRHNDGTNIKDDSCLNVIASAGIDRTLYGNHFGAGIVRITYLSSFPRYISGRFWADLCRPGCDTIRIRDGVFDVAY